MTTAQDHIADTLDRAQKCWDEVLNPNAPDNTAVSLLIYHVTTAVLLEHLRRLEPGLTELLVPWLCGVDGGIFADGYAGELLYQWRQQLAADQPLAPIGPDEAQP
jgi:hypothetical protein